MGLFDDTDVQSEEVAALIQARSILSTCASLKTLLEATTNAEALELIVLGSSEPPLSNNGTTYTVDELEDRIAWAQLYSKLDEDSFLCTWSKAVGATPEKEGFFRLHVRRQVRKSEYDQPESRNDLWMYFLDQTSAMCEEYIIAADFNLQTRQIKRIQGPVFNPQSSQASQGVFIWADFIIPWGGSEND